MGLFSDMPHDESFLLQVKRAQKGDPFAFDQLVRRFQDMAVGYALTLLREDRMSAEDAVQEAFLETYRGLNHLRVPAAFPGWLRRLVFKHCDRLRRGKAEASVSLESVQHRLYDMSDLENDLIRRQESERVREVMYSLPCTEAEVTALFYLNGCPTREIALFLEIPEATVRTRLHRARLRLRKDFSRMEIVENDRKPVRDAAENPVAARVLGEIVADYLKQQRENPETADRSLLAQARQQFSDRMNDTAPLDPETVRSGNNLLFLIGDHDSNVALMRRYLTQPLSISEEAWARFFLVNTLSGAERSQEVVSVQEELSRWMESLTPDNMPRLSCAWPFLPVPDTDSTTEIYPQDSLLLWTHYIPVSPNDWVKVGRLDDWLQRFHQILDNVPATDANRQQRFYFLRIALWTLLPLGRTEEAETLLLRVEALADEETNPLSVFHWRGHAIYLRMVQAKGDAETLRQVGDRAAVLLSLYEQALRAGEADSAIVTRFSILRDNIASVAADQDLYTLAVPLLTAQILSGRASEWVYVRLAKCVWASTHNKKDTLFLLRQGMLRNSAGDLRDWVESLPIFADLVEDPEFKVAISPKSI
jgi:RNA polymerase sigma factor (sigma-70 family)